MNIYFVLFFVYLVLMILNIKQFILYFHQMYKTLIKSFIIIIILFGFITIFNINLKINTKKPTYNEVLTYIV